MRGCGRRRSRSGPRGRPRSSSPATAAGTPRRRRRGPRRRGGSPARGAPRPRTPAAPYMPLEYRFTGVSRNRLDLGEGDDLVEAAADLRPAHAEDRAVEEDVLAPGQLGVEAGPDLEQRARRGRSPRPSPRVGSVIRERIFSSVLLPAPLWPIRPTTSPRWTVIEKSRSAQSVLASLLRAAARQPLQRAARGAGEALAQVAVCRSTPSMYSLPSLLVLIATPAMAQIRSAKLRSTRSK